MRITIASMATAVPMGQQAYETAITTALRDLAPIGLRLETLRLASLRSSVPADRRLPWKLLERAPAGLAVQLGRVAYRGSNLVHRLDLRLPPAHQREVTTIHDLPGLRFDDEGSLPAYLESGARRAAATIVPSGFAKQEVVELLGLSPDRVHVIPYGLSVEHQNDPGQPEDSGLLALPKLFVLHAAGATTRKNLGGLAQAWRAVASTVPDVHLFLCGPPDVRRTNLFRELPRTRLLGRVAAGDIAWLMHRAAAVVVPSTYEGFGLPALEGMAAGAPVVASRRGALSEVCADAAVLVEPDGTGLAEGLVRVLTDSSLAAHLHEAGLRRAREFSWRTAASAHVELYRQCLSEAGVR